MGAPAGKGISLALRKGKNRKRSFGKMESCLVFHARCAGRTLCDDHDVLNRLH